MAPNPGSPKRAVRRRERTPSGLIIRYRDEQTRTIAVSGYGADLLLTDITGENELRYRYSCTIDKTANFELSTAPIDQLDASWFDDNLGRAADSALWDFSPEARKLRTEMIDAPPIVVGPTKTERALKIIKITVLVIIAIALYLLFMIRTYHGSGFEYDH